MLFGWRGPIEARAAWPEAAQYFVAPDIIGRSEIKRTCAWDCWQRLGFDHSSTHLYRQQTGDCVAVGAATAVAATAAYEIDRLKQPERLEVPFSPYFYGTSRLCPEGGNGRLRGDGSLGSWMAAVIVKYGVLRTSYEGVPEYSGRLADRWGRDRSLWQRFVDEADNHLMKSAARCMDVEKLAHAVSNGYFATIASMRGYAMRLRYADGKGWFQGHDTWPHQMSILAVDTTPRLCFFRGNQWGNAHGRQPDGPAIGGWVPADELADELGDKGTECFLFSRFDGFPSDEEKPRNYFA